MAGVVVVTASFVFDSNDPCEPIGLGKWKRPPEQRVRKAQDGGARADDQRERDYSRDGKGRRARQNADRIPRIAPEGFEDRQSIHVTDLLEFHARVAEAEPGLPRGFLRRDSPIQPP
jgi:hypothetical protein